MLKRKFGNRSDWQRISKRSYSQTYLDGKDFKGYITLLHTISVTAPLFVNYGEKDLCIVDDGYMWLQQFPCEKNHTVTTMFNANGDIVQWYIDICLKNGVDNNGPWMDDLFLDIVLLPSGELFVIDADELDDALANRIINKRQYDLAWNEVKYIKAAIRAGKFNLLLLARVHKQRLSNFLE